MSQLFDSETGEVIPNIRTYKFIAELMPDNKKYPKITFVRIEFRSENATTALEYAETFLLSKFSGMKLHGVWITGA